MKHQMLAVCKVVRSFILKLVIEALFQKLEIQQGVNRTKVCCQEAYVLGRTIYNKQ